MLLCLKAVLHAWSREKFIISNNKSLKVLHYRTVCKYHNFLGLSIYIAEPDFWWQLPSVFLSPSLSEEGTV